MQSKSVKWCALAFLLTFALSSCRFRNFNSAQVNSEVTPTPIKIKVDINKLTAIEDMCKFSIPENLTPTINLSSTKYSVDKVLFLAAVSETVYRIANNEYKGILQQAGFMQMEMIRDEATGGDVLIATHATNAQVDAVLVGWTGSADQVDFLYDAEAVGIQAPPFQGTLHSGMYTGFEAVLPRVLRSLNRIVDENPNVPILITGHSLGGAHTVLFAEYLSLLNEQEYRYNINAVYALGQPRVGDRVFNSSFNRHFPQKEQRYVRIHNQHDPVSHAFPVKNAISTFSSLRVLTIASQLDAWGRVSTWLEQAKNADYVHADSTILKLRNNAQGQFYPEHFPLSTVQDETDDLKYWTIFTDTSNAKFFGSREYLENHRTAGSGGYVCNALKYYLQGK